MFNGLSVPAMLVSDNSQVVAINEQAAGLFVMPAEDIIGQRWAGLDAYGTLVKWKGIWRKIAAGGQHDYRTDIETSRQYMRPIQVEVRKFDGSYALLTLTDLIEPDITNNELNLFGQELQVGRWSYNRVDGTIFICTVCREILGLPQTAINKAEIATVMAEKMGPEESARMTQEGRRLLSQPGESSQDFVIEAPDRTALFNFTCRSVGNELHVTHLYGLVRRRHNHDDNQLDDGNHFSELAAFSLEQARDMVFWTRPDGSVRYANNAVSEVLGYGRGELPKVKVKNFAPEFDQQNHRAFWVRLRTEKSVELDYTLLSVDGKEIKIAAVINYIRFGEEEFACSINRDVTNRIQEDKRRRLMEISFDRAEDMIVWSRPDGSLYTANDTFIQRTGYQEDALATMTIDQVYTNHADLSEGLWARLRVGETLTYDTELCTADGTKTPVRARFTCFNYEGEEFMCIYFMDISNDREKDRLLSLSKLALDTAADCILWLDDKHRVQYANETLLKLLPPAMARSIRGCDVLAVLPGIDREKIAPGESQDFEMKTADRELRHMNLSCSLLKHDGQSYFVLIARDLSDLAEERQKLKSAYTEVEVMRDRLRDENLTLREENDTKYNVNNIITVSRKYQRILRQVGQVADVDTTVLITGETGTGKELLARAVHQLSSRGDFPLVKVNCATLPENLIESELFGHEKGAFTGAVSRKKGRFEMADRGTIFLDEIGELPIDLQAKLLRILQEDEFERLGGETTIKVDVRLIAATNRNLEEMVRDGKFREDLYYRLNVFPIHNLPLRDRPEDIPVLIEYFTKKYAKRQGKTINKINSADIKRLSNYPFPGNIRELENIIERSVVLCQSDTLSIEFVRANRSMASAKVLPFLSFEDMQRKHIIDALKRTGGRVTGPEGAGVLLGLNDRTLVSKIRKLQIQKHEYLL